MQGLKYIVLNIVKKTFALLLLATSLYQFWAVADRWIAAIKYRIFFGPSPDPWVTLSVDAVFPGLASLLLVCVLSFWVHRKVKDKVSEKLSIIALWMAVITFFALLILILLPTTKLIVTHP